MKFFPLIFIFLLSCVADTEAPKSAEDDSLSLDGKADSFYYPTSHGSITFGELESATISTDEKIHAWTFTVAGDAEITMRTGEDSQVDTVLYYYKKEIGRLRGGPTKRKMMT